MIALFVYELKQLLKSSLIWAVGGAFLLGILLVLRVAPVQPSAAPASIEEPLLTAVTILDERFEAAPEERRALREVRELLEEPLTSNERRGYDADPGVDPGPAGQIWRLLELSQSGVLILLTLALGMSHARFPASPSFRRAGTTASLTARFAALLVVLLLLFEVPRLTAGLWLQLTTGAESLYRLIPWNPRAGISLLEVSDNQLAGWSAYRAVDAAGVVSLGAAFRLAVLYEAAQIFCWLSLGLLLGQYGRKALTLTGAALGLLLLKHPLLAPLALPFRSFAFISYHDALRDTTGSPLMMRGLVLLENPLDFTLGIAILLVSGILLLYLTDLRLKGRLTLKRKGGTVLEEY